MPRDWFVMINLKFHVQIAPENRRFFQFAFMGQIFQFRVLPFGLVLAPGVFSKFGQVTLDVAITGRLACLCSITPTSNRSSSSLVGLYCGFMQACPNAVNQFHRSCSQLCQDAGFSSSRENIVYSEDCKAPSGWPFSALHFSHETLGEAHSSNDSSIWTVVAQAIPTMAYLKASVSSTRQIHKESHTSLYASSSTLVTEAVSPQRSSIGTSTCTVGGHQDRCQSSQMG